MVHQVVDSGQASDHEQIVVLVKFYLSFHNDWITILPSETFISLQQSDQQLEPVEGV